jgi:hypothetical protein
VAQEKGRRPPEHDQVPVEEVERLISAVPGVVRAKVVVNDWGAIEAIHVLADTRRPAKRMVRDIESALAAQLGILVDHRRISLAQLEGQGQGSLAPQLLLASYRVEADAVHRRTVAHVVLTRSDAPEARYPGSAQTGRGAGLAYALAQAAVAAVARALPEGVEVSLKSLRRLADGVPVWVAILQVRREAEALPPYLEAGAAVEHDAEGEAVVRAVLAAAAPLSSRLPLRGETGEEGDVGEEAQEGAEEPAWEENPPEPEGDGEGEEMT